LRGQEQQVALAQSLPGGIRCDQPGLQRRLECTFCVFLNSDHTHSLSDAVEAARAGFDLIGFDASALPFEENIAATRACSDSDAIFAGE